MASTSKAVGIQSFDEFLDETNSARYEAFLGRPYVQVESPEAFEDQKAHLRERYDGVDVAHSFEDENGQIFDCVPFEQQPAVKRSGRPASHPPDPPPPINARGLPAPQNTPRPLHPDRKDRYGNTMYSPYGTVPVRRLGLEKLTRFPTLRRFLSKRRSRPDTESPPEAATDFAAHKHALGSQSIGNVGGYSILSVDAVSVGADQGFSLSQVWFMNGPFASLQTVEAGWHVLSAKFGGSGRFPTLFTFATFDGYHTPTAYDDITLYNQPQFTPGQALISSGAPGTQMELAIVYRLIGGRWWLYAGGSDTANIVGFYETSRFNGGPMANDSNVIMFGGEAESDTGIFPPMGTGQPASKGREGSAYHRNILYFPSVAGARQNASLQIVNDAPTLYTAQVGNAADWGEFIFFGGPGGSVIQV